LQTLSLPQIPSPKPCAHLSCLSWVLHIQPIAFYLIWSPEKYVVGSTVGKVPHYVVFFIPLLLRPVSAWISTSAPYSRRPTACVPTSGWPQVSHPYKKMEKKRFCKSRSLYFWTASRKTKNFGPIVGKPSFTAICLGQMLIL
jgi:hypothetical protein